jgi:hypothetical protein
MLKSLPRPERRGLGSQDGQLRSGSYRREMPSSNECRSRRKLQAVDAGSDASRAETVVDVHDRHIRSATIEHPEQRGNSSKAGAVARARRHGDHRRRYQSADHARQCAFHARHTNDDARLGQQLAMPQQPVNARNAHVI